MGIKDWITVGTALLSALLLITSWFIISWLNRRNEIAKERMKFRFDLLFSILNCCDEAQRLVLAKGINVKDKNFTQNLFMSLRRMSLFGSSEEIALCNSIFQKLESGKPMGEEFNELQRHVVQRLKCELKFDK